jgi:adhesin/invasin
VPVRFVLTEGAGQAEPALDSSDAQGMARTSWMLGGAPGRQSLSVNAEGVVNPTLVTAEAEPVAANTRITVVSEHLEGPVGGTLPEPLTIRVTDSSGVALADVPIGWTPGDDGSIVASESRTDSLGEARARWTLGPKSGPQRVYVQIGNARAVPRFTVQASAVAGAPAGLTLVNGTKYEGSVGNVLRPLPELRVVDRAGNPVTGVEVTLLPTTGTLSDSIPMTDSTGRVRVSWTLGRNAGTHRMTARVNGVGRPVEISARVRAAGPANLTFVTPKPGTASRAIQSLDVDLTDAYGNPVADQPVVFSTKVGSVSPGRVMTDTHGRAHTRWTPGTKAGQRTLLAAVKGTDARASFVLEAPAVPVPLKSVVAKKKR